PLIERAGMASNSILFIPFILSNSFRRSYSLSEPDNHIPQFGQNFCSPHGAERDFEASRRTGSRGTPGGNRVE
ncbi:MAG: hypothetical protein NT069_19395, partial [Planctomycetota bacterium]|nr:hypothetical protein [Planctomycetota bacterium]